MLDSTIIGPIILSPPQESFSLFLYRAHLHGSCWGLSRDEKDLHEAFGLLGYLKTAKGRASGAIGLTMAERYVSGAIGLTMAERHVSGAIGLMMAERHVSGMIRLMMAERHVSSMIGHD
ncbi:hypothetical protein BHM03_00038559 [Ensete ventricosum]|nr:hypothetical protein BHM03_00038559 [Ensete ventricosum]